MAQFHHTCVSRYVVPSSLLTLRIVLSYLVGLVVCAVHHSEADSHVWRSGVRDYRWFTQRRSLQDPAETKLSYGRLVDPREPTGPPAIYAQQMGLTRNYSIEPLRINTTFERPVPPVPVASSGSQVIPFGRDTYRFPPPAPLPSSSSQPYSLYPQHLHATVGNVSAVTPRVGEPSPPAGSWPRVNPQEPLQRKERPPHRAASDFSPIGVPAAASPPSNLETAEQRNQNAPLPSAARSRPSGPRIPSASQRPRPPPLDLSRVSSHNELER
jgi:hypothetical protein